MFHSSEKKGGGRGEGFGAGEDRGVSGRRCICRGGGAGGGEGAQTDPSKECGLLSHGRGGNNRT